MLAIMYTITANVDTQRFFIIDYTLYLRLLEEHSSAQFDFTGRDLQGK